MLFYSLAQKGQLCGLTDTELALHVCAGVVLVVSQGKTFQGCT